jgi:hypothetical protein
VFLLIQHSEPLCLHGGMPRQQSTRWTAHWRDLLQLQEASDCFDVI